MKRSGALDADQRGGATPEETQSGAHLVHLVRNKSRNPMFNPRTQIVGGIEHDPLNRG